MEVLTVEHLSFTYPQASSPALEDVGFALAPGEFVTLCGATGSGKSTLLRLLKRELSPRGEQSGRILLCGEPADSLPPRQAARTVGFVMQQPEQQLVTDRVWHELAFGLENLGLPRELIARRVAETAGYFGIADWYDREVDTLSGGQKQLLCLAAAVAMQPALLLLDEPTARLDPIAASAFFDTLRRLNRDLSVTVLLSEHRLEQALPLSDRMLVLEGGRLREDGAPRRVIPRLAGSPALLRAMPAAARLGAALGAAECPLTVREGREWLGRHCIPPAGGTDSSAAPAVNPDAPAAPAAGSSASAPAAAPGACAPAGFSGARRESAALELREVWFRYEKQTPDVLRGLSLTVRQGEIFCVLGGNGSGKTTALGVAAGLLRPYGGGVRVFGRRLRAYPGQSLYRGCLALLPQDVQTVFLRNTVREELADAGTDASALPFDLGRLLDRHPYDLSGGEQQLLALARVLASSPRLLLLDEPTKGLDAGARENLIGILRDLRNAGMTVVAVTHDVDFAALCADRCALFFRGQTVSEGTPEAFFSENRFYTTAASRITRGYFDRVVTVEQAIARCAACLRREAADADD